MSMNPSRTLLGSSLSANITRVVTKGFTTPSTTAALRASYCGLQTPGIHSCRNFSTSRPARIEFFPPATETKEIQKTPAAWPHAKVTEEEITGIRVDHRVPRTFADAVAYRMVKFFKWGMNTATGYRNDPNKPYTLNARKWFVRFIFLETVAGVPGMTAAMLRHFRSLRRMKRDNGWIETMLEDAYNERMHLLTFMKMSEPGPLMKFLILGAQGVFANGFFLAYLVNPATCHRFVGYLEEEAVNTYTQAIQDLDAGKIPEWDNLEAPEIAVSYWHMPEGKRTMRDLLLYVRADEAKHREIHHTMGNLDYKEDPNPYASVYKDSSKPRPDAHGLKNLKAQGWERNDII